MKAALFAQIYWPLLVNTYRLLVVSSIIWLPLVLIYAAIKLWLAYVRADWIKNLNWVLLEIKLSKEIAKTPAAMEKVLDSFTKPERDDIINKWWKGEQRIWSSFEIASFGGAVHFFIRVRADLKNQIEAAVYAQYPTVEIFEVEDYVHKVPYGLPG